MSCNEGHYTAGSVTLAFLLGGAVGAALTALLSPRSGPENIDAIRTQADTLRREAQRMAEEVRERTEEIVGKGRDLVETKKAILESALEAGREAMEREKERLLGKLRKEGTLEEEA
ncbi:YtxH domain-containing protein [Dissulfurirhabdus thermomarina]|uniref:YtxH domain-containing protein n=1 Tax=Dissulfurirhabdus thermomarina TaxID=1765737 RepID=A0A6N9TJE6_DISTH|nr:YtxH domain-containing protein [Dissulfurirhabdus thermomarina]NDY41381.1 YtxH domain-containing protein [Dissulfurirhabdus thermomarina]NMX23603.1 YtxH domain-containing protein [Dissulfurirhabdus thermomarina]